MQNRKTTRRHLGNQSGFTLIEIIAVLVLLGILAAVAIPKYQDLQTEAREKAAQGAISAAQSALSMGYASYLLTNGNIPTQTQLLAVTALATNCGVTSDEFSIACAASGTDSISITVTGVTGTQFADMAEQTGNFKSEFTASGG